MFYFNSDKFDFWPIYDSIKEFYPIGVKKDETKMFRSYPGLRKLEKMISDRIHNDNQFKQWNDFTKQIETEVQKPVIGTTYGRAPCLSSYIEIDKFSHDNFTRTKELHFFVSVLGPFYTIVGQDNNTVKLENKHFKGTNYLTVSPQDEYASAFAFLCEQLEDKFAGYRFVPYNICKQTLEGLAITYSDNNLNTLFNAIFNDHVNLNIRALGDGYYKSKDWIKDNYVDNGGSWTSRSPF